MSISPLQLDALRVVVTKLYQANIPYQVSGGIAAIAYGATRDVYDIDIEVYQKDIPKAAELFKKYVVDPFYHHVQDGFDLWLMTLKIHGVPVDVCQAEGSYVTGRAGTKVRLASDLNQATVIKFGDLRVSVAAKDELINYKRVLGRPTDIQDIAQIS